MLQSLREIKKLIGDKELRDFEQEDIKFVTPGLKAKVVTKKPTKKKLPLNDEERIYITLKLLNKEHPPKPHKGGIAEDTILGYFDKEGIYDVTKDEIYQIYHLLKSEEFFIHNTSEATQLSSKGIIFPGQYEKKKNTINNSESLNNTEDDKFRADSKAGDPLRSYAKGINGKFKIPLTREELVTEIKEGKHEGYHIRNINGVKTPVTEPDSKIDSAIIGESKISGPKYGEAKYGESTYGKNKDKENEKNIKEYITSEKFLSDHLSVNDYIGGRKEFAEILKNKVSSIFNDNIQKGPFMLHLEGKWGSGKSTFMEYFQNELVKDKDWMVIKFDSWRYQHLIPNWWGFLEVIRRELGKELGFFKYALLKVKMFPLTWQWWILSLLLITFSILTFFFIDNLWFLTDLLNLISKNPKEVKNYISAGLAILGLFNPIKSFILKGYTDTKRIRKLYKTATHDEYEMASKYFQELTRIAKGEKKLAIFIDDLDRCHPKNAV